MDIHQHDRHIVLVRNAHSTRRHGCIPSEEWHEETVRAALVSNQSHDLVLHQTPDDLAPTDPRMNNAAPRATTQTVQEFRDLVDMIKIISDHVVGISDHATDHIGKFPVAGMNRQKNTASPFFHRGVNGFLPDNIHNTLISLFRDQRKPPHLHKTLPVSMIKVAQDDLKLIKRAGLSKSYLQMSHDQTAWTGSENTHGITDAPPDKKRDA